MGSVMLCCVSVIVEGSEVYRWGIYGTVSLHLLLSPLACKLFVHPCDSVSMGLLDMMIVAMAYPMLMDVGVHVQGLSLLPFMHALCMIGEGGMCDRGRRDV